MGKGDREAVDEVFPAAADETPAEIPEDLPTEEPGVAENDSPEKQLPIASAPIASQLLITNYSLQINPTSPLTTISDFGTPLGVPGIFNNLGSCFE